MKEKQKVLAQRGFSLIELLVVIAVIGIVLSLSLASLAATIRSTTKTTTFNQVKQSGELAMETISRSVRNAIDVCASDTTGNAIPDTLFLYDGRVSCSPLPGGWTQALQCIEGNPAGVTLEARNGEITKSDALGTPTSITSRVRITQTSCRFAASDTVPKRITLEFTMVQSADLPPDAPDYQVTIPFHSEVTLRNF